MEVLLYRSVEVISAPEDEAQFWQGVDQYWEAREGEKKSMGLLPKVILGLVAFAAAAGVFSTMKKKK